MRHPFEHVMLVMLHRLMLQAQDGSQAIGRVTDVTGLCYVDETEAVGPH